MKISELEFYSVSSFYKFLPLFFRSQYIFCTFRLLIDVEGYFYVSSPLITFALNKDNHLWQK